MPIGQFKAMWQCSDATWWPTLQTMQMVPPDDQIFNTCKLRHLVAKYATNASSAMLLLNLIQVTESISGSVVPLSMFLKHLRCWSRWEKWRASSGVRPVSRDFPLSRFQRRKNLPQPSFSGELSFLEMRHKCYRWLWFSKVFIVVTPNAAQLRE